MRGIHWLLSPLSDHAVCIACLSLQHIRGPDGKEFKVTKGAPQVRSSAIGGGKA